MTELQRQGQEWLDEALPGIIARVEAATGELIQLVDWREASPTLSREARFDVRGYRGLVIVSLNDLWYCGHPENELGRDQVRKRVAHHIETSLRQIAGKAKEWRKQR